MLLADTSVLIEYFRTPEKEGTFFFELTGRYDKIAISTITRYEIMVGNSPRQESFWHQLLSALETLSFDENVADEAAKIMKELKKENKVIGFADVAIAATARFHNIEIATLNAAHFNRVSGLKVITK